MQIIKGKKKIRGVIYLLLCLLTVFVCWLFVGRNGVFGAKVDWISQHSVIPDYFRQQFYDTGELFPEFAANLGAGQNIYHYSYYGLYSPVILVSYLLPFVKKSPIKDVGDGILRLPFRKRRIRPLYARQEQSLRLKRREKS